MTEHRQHRQTRPPDRPGEPAEILARARPPASERTAGGHDRHAGRPRSWILVGIVIAAFCAGGAALVIEPQPWWLFWLAIAIVVLAIPAGKIIGIMDDTVMVQGGTDPERERGG